MSTFTNNTSNFKLRKLEKSDYYYGFLQLLEQLTSVDSSNISLEEFCVQYDKLDQSNITVLVYVDNLNNIIGTGSIRIDPKFIHHLSSVGQIEDVVVDYNYRGQNIGKYIIDNLVNIAKEKGCYKVILNCSDSNIPFYLKCNFKQSSNQMAIYFKID